MEETQYAVRTVQLCKAYGKNGLAVDHVNLGVRRGDIYGFIGRNGAGKSTTMKMLCGLATPTSGAIELFGKPVTDVAARRRVGLLIETPGAYPNLTAQENVLLKARCLGLADEREADRVLALAGIAGTGSKKVRAFSMGMRQRLGIAMAFLGSPDLLILDEPTNGLDPEGIREIRETLLRINAQQGVTIMISSHILTELDKLATRYGVIHKGALMRELTREALADECSDYLQIETDTPEKAAFLLEQTLHAPRYEVADAHTLRVYGCRDAAGVNTCLVSHGLAVSAVRLHAQTLEDYFLALTQEGGEGHV